MATGRRSPHRTGALNLTSTNKRRNLRRLNPDLYRLSTFRLWRTNTQSRVSSVALSKYGFSYTDENDKVRCDTCGLEIDSWQPGMNPKQEHMERSPQCPFVLERTELFTKNGIYPFRLHQRSVEISTETDRLPVQCRSIGFSPELIFRASTILF